MGSCSVDLLVREIVPMILVDSARTLAGESVELEKCGFVVVAELEA